MPLVFIIEIFMVNTVVVTFAIIIADHTITTAAIDNIDHSHLGYFQHQLFHLGNCVVHANCCYLVLLRSLSFEPIDFKSNSVIE